MTINRQAIILEKLVNDHGCTIKQLSLLCDVSYKTIQSDIKCINDILKRNGSESFISTQRGVGAMIENCIKEEIENLIQELKENNTELQDYDKEFYTLKISFLLFRKEFIKIENLCDHLSLSRSVVNDVLSGVKRLLLKWNISVLPKPHYGLYVQGEESDIRRFMFENLVLRNEDELYKLLEIDSSTYFSLRERIITVIRNFDVSINDSILEQLLLYIEIMTLRLKDRHYLMHENFHLDKSSFEYILSEKIYHELPYPLSKESLDSEIHWIGRFIIGKCLKKADSEKLEEYEIVNKILPEALSIIKETYGFDFSHDIDLYTSMSIHLNALCKRAKVDNYLINPMLDNIKTYSLLAYDMATDISIYFNRMLKTVLPDDEISYFAIYLHLAIERQKQKIVPRKALAVCPSGKGMSEMVAHYIRKQFGEYISELRTCGYYELESIDYSQYDYIFTMKPLALQVPLPVIEFSLNANKQIIEKTRLQILGKKNIDFPLSTLTPPSLFYSDVKAESKEDALQKIVARIGSVIALSPLFYESVIRREEIVSTELDNGFAIPHPLDRDIAEQSFFSVTILNAPILWGRKKIRIILLTYIKGDMEGLDLFYDIFAQFVTSKDYQVALVDKPTYDCFVDIVREISEEVRNY